MKKKIFWVSISLVFIGVTLFLLAIFSDSNKIIAESQEFNNKKIPDSNYFFETYTSDDLKIGKIGLFSKSDEVLKYIGNPQTKHQVKESAINNPDYIVYTETWVYPGISILLSTSVKKGDSAPKKPDQVSGIVVTGSKYKTKRDIKIGDPIYKVLEKYGFRELDNNSYTYQVDLVYIEITVSKEKVSKIEIGGNPD